jgi:hypothetical protein
MLINRDTTDFVTYKLSSGHLLALFNRQLTNTLEKTTMMLQYIKEMGYFDTWNLPHVNLIFAVY